MTMGAGFEPDAHWNKKEIAAPRGNIALAADRRGTPSSGRCKARNCRGSCPVRRTCRPTNGAIGGADPSAADRGGNRPLASAGGRILGAE